MDKRRRRPDSYVDRGYRSQVAAGDLVSTYVQVKDTDLHILADRNVSDMAGDLALQYRLQVEDYIGKNPHFLHSLVPVSEDGQAPPLIKEMLDATLRAGVGPMAAVAGTIAEYVGRALIKKGCREVMVENGGDIFLQRTSDCRVAIFAGESPLSNRVGVCLRAIQMPVGICTSSGTVGHSLSFGEADSVTVIAGSTALADAAATRLGNEVRRAAGGDGGIKKTLEIGQCIEGVRGVVVICNELMGAAGEVELIKFSPRSAPLRQSP